MKWKLGIIKYNSKNNKQQLILLRERNKLREQVWKTECECVCVCVRAWVRERDRMKGKMYEKVHIT